MRRLFARQLGFERNREILQQLNFGENFCRRSAGCALSSLRMAASRGERCLKVNCEPANHHQRDNQ
jgi:hypothetical protein